MWLRLFTLPETQRWEYHLLNSTNRRRSGSKTRVCSTKSLKFFSSALISASTMPRSSTKFSSRRVMKSWNVSDVRLCFMVENLLKTWLLYFAHKRLTAFWTSRKGKNNANSAIRSCSGLQRGLVLVVSHLEGMQSGIKSIHFAFCKLKWEMIAVPYQSHSASCLRSTLAAFWAISRYCYQSHWKFGKNLKQKKESVRMIVKWWEKLFILNGFVDTCILSCIVRFVSSFVQYRDSRWEIAREREINGLKRWTGLSAFGAPIPK